MSRTLSIILLAWALLAPGCTFEAGAGGYFFPAPGDETGIPEDTPPDPGLDLGQACFDFFACTLAISTQGGSVDGCVKEEPKELLDHLEEIQSCHVENCNDLKYDPESESFAPIAFRNCLKYECSEAVVSCFAHTENVEGCKKYVLCEQNCSDTGVACDLSCMMKLSPEDVPSTVGYLNCMKEFKEVHDADITEKLCECLAICEVPYVICDNPDDR